MTGPGSLICARKPCGCLGAVTTQSVAADKLQVLQAEWALLGWTVESLPRAVALDSIGPCKCPKKVSE